MTPAWIVCSWPPVLWQAGESRDWHFVHLGTRVLNHGDARHPSSGQTVWGNASTQPAAGLAWDWIELPQGVLALADPMGMVSNVQFIDADGCVLPSMQCAMQLNGIVHALPWQDEVHRALHSSIAA